MQQESGHQFGELYSELETQKFEPNSENQPQTEKKRSYLLSSSTAVVGCTPHVRQKSSMKDSGRNTDLGLQEPTPVSTRSALRRAGAGEIVEVQGGHIVRATGQKDRHSKVCTAKGPRDRRVRLAAHTAIQFYDVQDRLGYDRPSKAVDWLIKKAKASIDELEQLPAWSPTSINMNVSATSKRRGKGSGGDKLVELGAQNGGGGGGGGGANGGDGVFGETYRKQHQQQQQGDGMYGNCGGSLLPPSLDSDAIADTIKSFFPMGGGMSASAASTRPQMLFQDYIHGAGGAGEGGRQDLRLSLKSFQVQDHNLIHSHHHNQNQTHEPQHSVFSGATSVGFENPNWADNQHQSSPELGRLHRLVVGWQNQHHNTGIDQHHHSGSGGTGLGSTCGGGGDVSGGFLFNQPPLFQPLFGDQHNQYFTPRGPLQSSNTSSIRAWISDPSIATSSEHLQAIPIHPQGFQGLGFSSGVFSGFHIPTRIQGDEEHDGELKPSSVSSGSHH